MNKRLPSFCVVVCVSAFVAGCGAVGSNTTTNTPNGVPPTITSQPASLTVIAGQTATFSVVASGTGPLSYQWSENGSAISGATSSSYTTPATADSDTGEQFTLTISNSFGSMTSNPVTLTVTPISVQSSPQAWALLTGAAKQFTVVTNDASGVIWSAAKGAIDQSGNYTAPSGTPSTTDTVTVTSKTDPTVSASATVHVVAPGALAPTNNSQVALYTITPGADANVSAQFGLTTGYGLTTWAQPVPQAGGAVSLFVAGMQASSTYHIQGLVQFSDGTQYADADQTFATGSPVSGLPAIKATTTQGVTPQSGVELLDLIVGGSATTSPVAATDLNGNVIWSYISALPGKIANPIKLLPNGHFLIDYTQSSSAVDGTGSVLEEVDLGGNVISDFTAANLNAALASANCGGDGCSNLTVVGAHHDFVLLPNGHLIVIAGAQRNISGTVVTGDVIIDLDQNHNPVWTWNEFNHLNTSRQPMGWPDWTHTNAVIYSPDDGNLIISIRHQNWLVKINYANGQGNGIILWRLGYEGDFTLLDSTGAADSNPADWFFAQHGPSFVSKNTTGNFTLALFDNGNDRATSSGTTPTCGTTGAQPCFSTAPILQIDETAMTATLLFNPVTPAYSVFGGNNAVLSNGDMEYCESAGGPGTAGDIYEVTQPGNSQTVWQMHITNQFAYRGQRMPSLYPGVQW